MQALQPDSVLMPAMEAKSSEPQPSDGQAHSQQHSSGTAPTTGHADEAAILAGLDAMLQQPDTMPYSYEDEDWFSSWMHEGRAADLPVHQVPTLMGCQPIDGCPGPGASCAQLPPGASQPAQSAVPSPAPAPAAASAPDQPKAAAFPHALDSERVAQQDIASGQQQPPNADVPASPEASVPRAGTAGARTSAQAQPQQNADDASGHAPGNFITSPALAAISRHERTAAATAQKGWCAAAGSDAQAHQAAATEPCEGSKNGKQSTPTASLKPTKKAAAVQEQHQQKAAGSRPRARAPQQRAQGRSLLAPQPAGLEGRAALGPGGRAPASQPGNTRLDKPHPLASAAAACLHADAASSEGCTASQQGGAGLPGSDELSQLDQLLGVEDWVASMMPAFASHVARGMVHEAAGGCSRPAAHVIRTSQHHTWQHRYYQLHH